MKSLKKLFASKEIKEILGILDAANNKFEPSRRTLFPYQEAFRIVRNEIENVIFLDPKEFTQYIRGLKSDGRSLHGWVYSSIANMAGSKVETGQYHLHRGYLNEMSPGPSLLELFNSAVDELVQMNEVDAHFAAEQKKALLKNIETVG